MKSTLRKNCFFFNGDKHFEIVDDEQIYYFQDGSVFQKCSYKDNEKICISYSMINLFSDQKMFFAEDLKYKSKFISEYRIVNGQWKLDKCYDNEKECENFIHKNQPNEFYEEYHIEYCECE